MDTKSSSNNPDNPYNTERRILYAKAPDGVGIAYWTLGAGRPLVYMTGGPWNHIELWQMPECRRWYEQLAQRRMLVRYDVRGTGMSERNVVDHSLQAQVSDLQAVLSRVGQHRFDLFAAAGAGPAAISYVASHPERVGRLVLWCAWARGSDIRVPRIQAWLSLIEKDWDLMTDTCAQIVIGWSGGEIGRHAADNLRESVTRETAKAALDAIGGYDGTALLPQIQIPTLVLHRRDIAWIPADIGKELASRIPNARLHLLEGESPAPYLGDSRLALALIEEFLGESGESSAVTEPKEADDMLAVAGDGQIEPTTTQSQVEGKIGPVGDFERLKPGAPYPDGLTAREVEVLRLLAGGYTNSEIARELFLSVRTVERHIGNIYGKINARGRAHATAYALTRNLL